MLDMLLIAAGGALGALGRFGAGWVVQRLLGYGFPWGTFAVNVVGCLLLGLVLELAHHGSPVSREAQVFLAVGFLGAFTTFSTFGYETVRLLEDGRAAVALANAGGSVVVGLLACWAGIALARTWIG
ncbi:MAG: fluoride efflux transporter CrcB [Myxococcota bacterium]